VHHKHNTEAKKLARSYYRAETLAEVNFKDFGNFVCQSQFQVWTDCSIGGIVPLAEMLKSPPPPQPPLPPPPPRPNRKKIIKNSVCKRAACETVRPVI